MCAIESNEEITVMMWRVHRVINKLSDHHIFRVISRENWEGFLSIGFSRYVFSMMVYFFPPSLLNNFLCIFWLAMLGWNGRPDWAWLVGFSSSFPLFLSHSIPCTHTPPPPSSPSGDNDSRGLNHKRIDERNPRENIKSAIVWAAKPTSDDEIYEK